MRDFADVGEPPTDNVLAIGRWLQRVVAITAHQARKGRSTQKRRHAIRASCKAAARLLPSAMTARALGLADVVDQEVDPDGPPPDDPLLVNDWFLLNLVADVYRQIQGSGDNAVGEEWRAASTAAVKVWPPDLMVEAGRILREELSRGERVQDGPEPVRFEDVEAVGAERPGSLNLEAEADHGE